MKRYHIPKTALICFIAGLMMTTLTPILGRYIPISAFLKGIINGLGLMLEVIAIIKISRRNKDNKCKHHIANGS